MINDDHDSYCKKQPASTNVNESTITDNAQQFDQETDYFDILNKFTYEIKAAKRLILSNRNNKNSRNVSGKAINKRTKPKTAVICLNDENQSSQSKKAKIREEFLKKLIKRNNKINAKSKRKTNETSAQPANPSIKDSRKSIGKFDGNNLLKCFGDQLQSNQSNPDNCKLNQLFTNFSVYQKTLQLYKLCQYKHLQKPLYLTCSLSYVEHFQYELNICKSQASNQSTNKSLLNSEDHSKEMEQTAVESEDGSNLTANDLRVDHNNGQQESKPSNALILIPLAINHLRGFKYATIDLFVIRRQIFNLTSSNYDDCKIYVGTSYVKLGKSKSQIINNRIIIPLKLFFESDACCRDDDSGEAKHLTLNSSNNYKFFIYNLVSFYRQNDWINSKFINKPSPKSSINYDSDNCVRFFSGFELENIDDIYFIQDFTSSSTKQLAHSDYSDSTNNSEKPRKTKTKSLCHDTTNGEETHLLWPIDNTDHTYDADNLIKHINKWLPITSSDIFDRSAYHNVTKRDSWNPSGINYLITFRLLRTNMSDDECQHQNTSELESNKCNKYPIKLFNHRMGKLVTRRKLIDDRRLSHLNFNRDCDSRNDSSHSNETAKRNDVKRVLRPNTCRQRAAIIAAQSSANNQAQTKTIESNVSVQKPNHARLIHENDSFMVIYHFAGIQSNLISEDMTCVLCSSNFCLLSQLSIHLNVNHGRFKFKISIDPDDENIVISATLNQRFEDKFDNTDPLTKALNFARKQPPASVNDLDLNHSLCSRKRLNKPERRATMNKSQPLTTMISIGRNNRSLCTMFTFNEETGHCRVDLRRHSDFFEEECHRRLFYHSRTMLPILASEMNEDSETEEIAWRMRLRRHLMQDFIDVNPGEKTVMALWNQFMMKNRNRYSADCLMSDAVRDFIYSSARLMIISNLKNNCILHLLNMYRFKSIDQTVVHEAISFLNKIEYYYGKCRIMAIPLQTCTTNQLPESVRKMMQYFPVQDLPIEYIDSSPLTPYSVRNYDGTMEMFNQDHINHILGTNLHLFSFKTNNRSKHDQLMNAVNNLQSFTVIPLLSLSDYRSVANTYIFNRGHQQLQRHLPFTRTQHLNRPNIINLHKYFLANYIQSYSIDHQTDSLTN